MHVGIHRQDQYIRKSVKDIDDLKELRERLTSADDKWQSHDSVSMAASSTNVGTSLKEEPPHSKHQPNKLIEASLSFHYISDSYQSFLIKGLIR